MLTIRKPVPSELNTYYQSYLKYIPEEDMLDVLIKQKEITQKFLQSIPESKASSAYADGKWLLKEVVGQQGITRNGILFLKGISEFYVMRVRRTQGRIAFGIVILIYIILKRIQVGKGRPVNSFAIGKRELAVFVE